MKNLVKIFMAVVALFAFSCTTDTTYDQGVELGNGANGEGKGVTVLSVQLAQNEAPRTQLGTPNNGMYPVTWSAGDKISVNGVESEEAEIDSENGAIAKFTILKGNLGSELRIAYPAADDNQVEFAAVQTHAGNGTFGSGVATMYGYSADGTNLRLHHLTGVLKIGVVGTAKLTDAQISTIDRAPIAGTFNLDFESGKLTATESASDVIEYSFGEGVTLSSEQPTYIHAVVPAGVYDELYVTLYDSEGGVMYGTIKAPDTNKLNPGKVRVFGNSVTYAPNQSLFVIKDYATLCAFKAAVESTDGLAKDAVLVADVTVPADADIDTEKGEVAWSSINGENYIGTLRGNGYAIKGLTQPLFNTTSASFKGLHLEDVAIEETEPNVALGALARIIDSETAVVEHCSTSGSIVVNHNAAASADIYVAGLIAKSTSTQTFSHLTNEVNIEVKKGSFTYTNKQYISGCIGSAASTTLSHATNLGNIKYYATTTGAVYLGGVSQKCKDTSYCNNGLAGCNTKGIIEFAGSGKTVTAGGIADTSSGTIQNCTNYGTINFGGTLTGTIHIGGIIRVTCATITDCTNYGAINFTANASGISPYIGGIAPNATATRTFTRCKNEGALTVTNDAQLTSIFIGGMLGNTTAKELTITFNECSNHGPITVNGQVSSSVRVGGLISAMSQKDSKSHTVKILNSYTNGKTATLTVGQTGSTSTQVGGLVGNMSSTLSAESTGTIKNEGTINYTGTTGNVNIGGIVGAAISNTFGSDTYNLINTGDINATGTGTRETYRVGGIYGNSNRVVQNARCHCTIVASSDCLGVGMIYGGSKSSTASNAHIGGSISKDGGETTTPITVSNYYNYIYHNAITQDTAATNSCGWISKIDATPKYSNEEHLIGSYDELVAFAGEAPTTKKNALLTADITVPEGETWTSIDGFEGIFDGDNYTISGLNAPLFGTTNAAIIKNLTLTNVDISMEYSSAVGALACKIENTDAVIENCSVSGKMTIDCTDATADLYIGGLFGTLASTNQTLTGLVNDVDITVVGRCEKTVYTGGLVPKIEHAVKFVNCHNEGELAISDVVTDGTTIVETTSKGVLMGGMAAIASIGTVTIAFDGCSNSGALTVNPVDMTGNIKVGGCIGHIGSSFSLDILNGYTNSGTITVAHSSCTSVVQIGGMFGNFSNKWSANSTGVLRNSGAINYSGKTAENQTVKIAGIFAAAGSVTIPTIDASVFSIINEGDITVAQGCDTGKLYIGGIMGTLKPLSNARCHCTISAISYTTNVGMIAPTARTETAKVTNCHIGGVIDQGTERQTMDPETGDPVMGWVSSNPDPISKSDYFSFIYGNNAITAEQAVADGCGYISSIDATTPIGPDGNAVPPYTAPSAE